MKKVVLLIICVIAFLSNYNVNAKDTFKTINKYKEENFEFIIKDYKNKEEKTGFVTAGSFTDEEETNDNEKHDIKKIVLAKYDNNAKLTWIYNYGKSLDDILYSLDYSYDNKGKEDGYLLTVKASNDTSSVQHKFIKVDYNGKFVSEHIISLDTSSEITKVIKTTNSDNVFDGYIVVGNKQAENNKIGFIIKYDIYFNEIWKKEYKDDNYSTTLIKDFISINNSNKYYSIVYCEKDKEKVFKLVSFNDNGEFQEVIKDDFDGDDNPKLLDANDSFYVYGYNHNVKLKNNKNVSYYILKYNLNNEEEWETISNTPTNDQNILKVQPVYDKDKIKELLMMATNDNDSSIEITSIDQEGMIKDKVKKIKNDYYHINSFIFANNNIYFVGQITCPDDDNCDYNMKSLVLMSTEDKVIEVKKEDNTNIAIISGIILFLIIIIYILRKISKKEK